MISSETFREPCFTGHLYSGPTFQNQLTATVRTARRQLIVRVDWMQTSESSHSSELTDLSGMCHETAVCQFKKQMAQ